MEEGDAKRFCSALKIEGNNVVGYRGDRGDITNVVIPNGIDGIGDDAFEYCSALTSLTLPHSLVHVGDYAFQGCTALTSLTLPHSLVDVGAGAFNSCDALTSLTLPNSVKSIGNGAFAYPGSLGRPTLWVSRGCNSLCREDRAQALSL